MRLLADLRDASGEPIGRLYAPAPEVQQVTLRVAPLPARTGGGYDPRTRTLTIAEALLDEDPRVVAVALVHELRHALDYDLVVLGLLERDCIELEVSAFEAQAKITRAFWSDELPGGTDWEQGFGGAVVAYERDGLERLRAGVVRDPGYRERCTTA